MGALYEDVERFFGDIFAAYGRLLSKWPYVFIISSAVLNCLLGIGLIKLRFVTDVESLYTPINSDAKTERDYLSNLFSQNTSSFYGHQQFYAGPYANLIFTSKPYGNLDLLNNQSLQEIDYVLNRVEGLKNFNSLCAKNNRKCAIDGLDALQSIRKGKECKIKADDSFAIFQSDNDNQCDRLLAFKIRFYLKRDGVLEESKIWLKDFLNLIDSLVDNLNFTTVDYSSTESLSIELNAKVKYDLKKFIYTVLIMIIYTSIVNCGGNWVTTRIKMAQAGIIAVLMAILASCGLLSAIGVPFADSCGVMPFLILGIGVDDMFILLSSWRRTPINATVEERIRETLRSSAISVTITSLTDILAFCIGATTPFLSVKCFCVYSGLAIFLCYFNQLTFFGGCLVLHARRVTNSRHCLTCMKTETTSELRRQGYRETYILLCNGHPTSKNDVESLCRKVPCAKALPKLLLTRPAKLLIGIIFIIYLCISGWSAAKTKHGMKLEQVVSERSYFHSYIDTERRYFKKQGPIIMLILTEPYDYRLESNRYTIKKLLNEIKSFKNMDENFKISWLDNCLNITALKFVDNNKEKEFLNDIVVRHGQIVASRFYLRSIRIETADDERDLMTYSRNVTKNISFAKFIAFSPHFVYYEHYVSIIKNTLLSVTVCIIGMLLVAIMFIPHPISITCLALSMLSIVLGMFGLMQLWNVALSSITTVQVILSVGLCVDFNLHISHSFMAATGKNRNERVRQALQKVGVPILNAAFSSILGIIMLASANSYIFISFFKTMLLVILLGLFHSLLILPVLLSFIGPRRTNTPRVFIPISPASRSIQPTEFKRGSTNCTRSGSALVKQESKDDYYTPRQSPRMQAATTMPLVRFDRTLSRQSNKGRFERQEAVDVYNLTISEIKGISADSRSDCFYSAEDDNESFISAL